MWAGAGLADAEAAFGGTAYTHGRGRATVAVRQWFGLPELRPIHARAGARWARSSWVSAGLTALSFEGYRRHVLTTGLTTRVGPGTVDSKLRVAAARAGDLGARRAVALAATTRFPVSRRVDVAVSIDPVLATPGLLDAGMDSRFTIGMAWRVSPDFRLFLDRTHRSPDSPTFALGLAWVAHPLLEVRLGASTRPVVRSVGILAYRPALVLGLLVSHHDPLGWTTGIGVEWSW